LDEQSIEGIFALSYNDLPAPVAWVYRSVSLHPGQSFVVEVAAAAAGRPVDDVANSVRELVNRTMLEELDEGRFRLHDLQRDYARQQAEQTDSEHDRHAANRRMLEWYLNRAVDADLVLRPTRKRVGPLFADKREPGFASHQDALDWVKGEQRNIVLAVHTADEHGWDDLTWKFCEALWGFFLHHRFYSDWLDIHALGIPAAEREGNVLAQACLRTQLCFALTGLHRYDDAIREGRIALDLAVQENDKATEAMVLGELAGAVQGTGDLRGALSYLEQAKDIREQIGNDRAVAFRAGVDEPSQPSRPRRWRPACKWWPPPMRRGKWRTR
jgi:hypothetical protein